MVTSRQKRGYNYHKYLGLYTVGICTWLNGVKLYKKPRAQTKDPMTLCPRVIKQIASNCQNNLTCRSFMDFHTIYTNIQTKIMQHVKT